MSKPCPAHTQSCENEELCDTRGCVRLDPPVQSGKPPPLQLYDLRERVRRIIVLGMGSMLGAPEASQEAYLRLLARTAADDLRADLKATVDAVIAEVRQTAADELQAPPRAAELRLGSEAFPDPTAAMLVGDALFDAIWNAMQGWDIGVPAVYSGYCGALGNHARAIYDAVTQVAGMVLVPDSAEEKQLKAARLAERTCGLARHEDGTISYSGYQRIYEAMVSPFVPPRPEDVLTPTGEAEREALAEAIYSSRGFYPGEPRPAWVPRGNSHRQDEARDIADSVLAARAKKGAA